MYESYYNVPISKLQEVFTMSLSKYEIFLKVVELGSLTKAAEMLRCTQSAVSHSINALEKETRLKLITRSRAGVQLTPDGERLMPSVRKIVEALESFSDSLAGIHGLETGCVRIGAFTSVAVHWLPNMIKQYQSRHPNIDFRMLTGDYHDIVQWFDNGSIDLGFVTKDIAISGCESIPLAEDRILAVLPKNHRLAGKSSISAADIADEPFISLLENSAQDARSVLRQANVNVNTRYTAKDDYAIMAMVEQGLGISIMPELLLEGRPEGICAIPIEGAPKRTIALAVSSAGSVSPSVQDFSRFVSLWVNEKYNKNKDPKP